MENNRLILCRAKTTFNYSRNVKIGETVYVDKERLANMIHIVEPIDSLSDNTNSTENSPDKSYKKGKRKYKKNK